MSSYVSSADVTVRCRVRKAIQAGCPNFSQRIEMKCLLRTGLDGNHRINDESIPFSTKLNTHLGIPELYFIPNDHIQTPRNTPQMKKKTPERDSSPSRQRLVPPSTTDGSTAIPSGIPISVRSTSPDPCTQNTNLKTSQTVSPSQTRSVSRNRLSSPENRQRAASFFAVKTSPSPSIEHIHHCPFTISVGSITCVELVSSSSIDPSSMDSAFILITLDSNEIYEITFFKMDALEILHACLCAMIPSGRRKVRIASIDMIDDVENPIVYDVAQFEAETMEDCFRNESYLDRMSRRSTRLFQRFCDALTGMSDYCGSLQQSPITTTSEYADYYDSPFTTKDEVSLRLSLHDKDGYDRVSGLELQTSPTLHSTISDGSLPK